MPCTLPFDSDVSASPQTVCFPYPSLILTSVPGASQHTPVLASPWQVSCCGMLRIPLVWCRCAAGGSQITCLCVVFSVQRSIAHILSHWWLQSAPRLMLAVHHCDRPATRGKFFLASSFSLTVGCRVHCMPCAAPPLTPGRLISCTCMHMYGPRVLACFASVS